MKYLGIDYGSKRIGLSISDENASFAFPLEVLKNSEESLGRISEICKEKNIGTIVVGDSQNFQMQKNEIMKEVSPFVEELRKISGLPVLFHPEFMTSQEAERLQPRRLRSGSRLRRRETKNDMLDASAAAIILKSYLDTKH